MTLAKTAQQAGDAILTKLCVTLARQRTLRDNGGAAARLALYFCPCHRHL